MHLFATAYKQHMLERERQYHRNIGPLILAWYRAIDGIKAYKLCRNALFAWLERAQSKLGAYKEDGVARRRDQESYEADTAWNSESHMKKRLCYVETELLPN